MNRLGALVAELDDLESELESLAAAADSLHSGLDRLGGWHEVRDLLEREFHPDLDKPGARLWFNTVVDDIVTVLVGSLEEEAHSLALRLRDLVRDEEAERLEAEIQARARCLDCKVSTFAIGEYYMLHNAVWAATGMGPEEGMLCIGCVETRLGRRLVPDDFMPAPANLVGSERLLSRVHGREEASAA